MPPRPPYRRTALALLSLCLFGAALVFFLPELSSPGALSVLPRVDPAGVLQVKTWNDFTSREFFRGHFPLWNPHTALGQPHLANLQTAVFFPLGLLRAGLSSPLAQDGILVLRLILAGLLVSALVQSLGAKWSGALAAGLCYAFGGYGLWFMQLVDLNSQMLLPLLMLVFGKLFSRRRLGWFGASSLLSALVILGGHPEAVFNTFALAWLYVLFIAAAAPPGRRPSLSAFGPVAASSLLGALLAGLVLLPFANYLPRCWSLHAPGFGFFHLEARGILNLFWPGIHRIFADQPAGLPLELLERGTLGLLVSGYRETAVPGVPPGLGIIPLGFALLALFRLRRLPAAASFFAAVLAVLLGLTFGLPGFRLIALLPVFNLASNFKFYFSEIHLALAVLAGFGIQAIPARAGAPVRSRLPRWSPAPLLLLALLANLYYHSRQVKPYLELGARDLDRAPYLAYLLAEQEAALGRELGPNGGRFRITGLEGFFPANLALSFGLDDLRSSDALFYRPSLELLNRLNGLDPKAALRYFYPSYYTQPSPEKLDRPLAALLGIRFALGLRPLPAGEIMEQVLYRGSGVAGQALPRKLIDDSLDPPQAVLFQHPPSRLDYPLAPAEAETRLGFTPWLMDFGRDSDGAEFELYGETSPGIKLLFARFLARRDLPANRFEISLPQATLLRLATGPGPRDNRDSDWASWAELTATAPDSPPPFPRVTLADQAGRPVFAAENPRAFPRAFSVSRSLAAAPAEELPILGSLSLEQMKEAATVTEPGFSVQGFPADHGRVKLISYEPDRVVVQVRRASPGLLVLADAAYPGWRAEVDGTEAKILRADHALRAVAIQPGKRQVLFEFQPLDFRIGLWVSLISLAVAAAASGFAGWKTLTSRRRPDAHA